MVVAIGTGGKAPVLARRLRERIEMLLPARIGELAELMGRHRGRLAALPRARSPRRFWQDVIAGPIADAVLAGRRAEGEARLTSAIDAMAARRRDDACETVFLVGAGPGDPDLLTLRALHALADADVVFYDELVTAAVLDRARRDAEQVFVGKRRGEPGIAQDEINRSLTEAARAGRCVVRLKGGDPFIFGRGGEELEYLRSAGVPVVVVPGITAALGCAAEAGLAADVPQRGLQARLDHGAPRRGSGRDRLVGHSPIRRRRSSSTWVLSSAAAVRDGLIAAGRDPATPVAVLARGTRPDSQAAVGRLDALSALAAAGGRGTRDPRHRRGGGALDAVAGGRARARRGAGRRMTSPLQQKLKITGPVVVTAQPARRRRGGLAHGDAVGRRDLLRPRW